MVPADLTVHDLHLIIQAAMGWDNYHLYDFSLGKQRFSIPDSDDYQTDVTIDSRKMKLENIYSSGKSTRLHYIYDFGDSWEHDVIIEKSLEEVAEEKYPRCIDGARACPLEDCGSVPGYYELVEAFAKPNDKKYKELRDWAGGEYNPEVFDLNEADKNVHKYKEMEADAGTFAVDSIWKAFK